MALIDFIAVKITCEESFREILIAELGELEFNSMMETEEGLEAYIESNIFDATQVEEIIMRYNDQTNISYKIEQVASRNWNEEWEKNYDPIIIEDKCLVRASFHDVPGQFDYVITINPRMSFGTGHHSTTYLMLKNQMEVDHKDKRVLDAGCGTAILAVMAAKLGAKQVVAYDNNSWSTENAPENVELNHCDNVSIYEGTIESLQLEGKFDIILANINKNVLLDELKQYQSYSPTGGVIMLSGFYQADNEDLIAEAKKYHLKLVNTDTKNDWSCLIFKKV